LYREDVGLVTVWICYQVVGSEEMTEAIKTVCRMCSGRGCGMRVTVQNGRVIKVEGDPDNPINLGGLCAKGLSAIQLEYDQRRILHPLRRKGRRGEGHWEQISLDEAINIAARKLSEIKEKRGAKFIAWYKGAATGWDTPWAYLERFMNILGSPNIVSHSNVCYLPGLIAAAAVYGPRTQPDYEHANLILVWGFNPGNTSPSYARRILDAKERGARIIVIDSNFCEFASKAGEFIQIRPGSDGALALGMMHVIINENLYDKDFVKNWTVGFDELRELAQNYPPETVEEITWIPKDEVIKLGRTYATTKQACIEDGNALEQHTNAVQGIRSLRMLPALTGNLGVIGGEIFIPRLQTADVLLKDKLPTGVQSISQHPLYERTSFHIATPDLVDAILTEKPYSVKALVVQGGCPVMSTADTRRTREALKKLDFLVVHELFMSATAELADIIIPSTTFLETEVLYKYWSRVPDAYSNMIGLQRKVVEPLGESISEEGFRIKLAQGMGMKEYFPWKDVKESIGEELKPLSLSYEDLEKRGFYQVRHSEKDLHKSYENTGFATPSGKVEFYSSTYKDFGYDPLPDFKEPAESPMSSPDIFRDYPLIGVAGTKNAIWTHSQFRTLSWLNEIEAEPSVEINPEKADELGIGDGDYVTVESPRGSIEIKVKITKRTLPDVVCITPGWGQPYSIYKDKFVNVLTDQSTRCPVSAALPLRTFLCRIKKA
jgi:anaerobic selenocysteine-containing dehydrogenase